MSGWVAALVAKYYDRLALCALERRIVEFRQEDKINQLEVHGFVWRNLDLHNEICYNELVVISDISHTFQAFSPCHLLYSSESTLRRWAKLTLTKLYGLLSPLLTIPFCSSFQIWILFYCRFSLNIGSKTCLTWFRAALYTFWMRCWNLYPSS